MKYMCQSLFDCCAIKLAEARLGGDENVARFLEFVQERYGKSCPKDNFWWRQIIDVSVEVLKYAQDTRAKYPDALLSMAFEYRASLGDQMEELSGIKKIFNGTYFTKSHPDPMTRPKISIVNSNRSILIVSPKYFLYEVNKPLDDIMSALQKK